MNSRDSAQRFAGFWPFPYLCGRRLAVLAATYLVIGAVVLGLVLAARAVLIQEVRGKARELASLIALHVDAKAHEKIHTREDMERPEFLDLVEYFQNVISTHHDIVFVYTMRMKGDDTWEYVVDAQPYDVDHNQDGIIQEHEEGVWPGRPMTRLSEAKLAALKEPAAERRFYADQWGTFISGYAPIVDMETGKTIGILGVDVPKRTIHRKLTMVSLAGAGALLVLMVMATMGLGALFQKVEALDTIKRLDREIQARNSELARKVETLKDQDRLVQHELELAREVQQQFLPYLPDRFPDAGHVSCAASYRAASVIGGDLYDVFQLSPRVLAFFMADVSGHGVSAALITTLLKVSCDRYRRILDESVDSVGLQSPELRKAIRQFMRRLNGAIAETTQTGRFVTFTLHLLDTQTGDVLLANAGHNPPMLWKQAQRTVTEVEIPANLPFGLMGDTDFEITHLRIEQGDKLVVYTDGLTERRNRNGQEFSIERFRALIAEKGDASPHELVDHVMKATEEFSENTPADDDQAILVVEFL